MALNLTDNWQMDKILTDNWHLYPPSRPSKYGFLVDGRLKAFLHLFFLIAWANFGLMIRWVFKFCFLKFSFEDGSYFKTHGT